MSGYMNFDGSALAGALNPAGTGQALQVDNNGNLKVSTTGPSSAASDGVTPANVPLVEVGIFNGTTIDRLQGVNGAASVQDWLHQLAIQGKSFIATTGLLNLAAGTYPLSIFNPAASGKNILLYSLRCSCGSGSLVAQVQDVTSNPAFASAALVSNTRIGGPVSAIVTSCTFASTSQSVIGTALDAHLGQQNNALELLSNGTIYLLPSGSANGIVTYLTTFGSGYVIINAHWAEF